MLSASFLSDACKKLRGMAVMMRLRSSTVALASVVFKGSRVSFKRFSANKICSKAWLAGRDVGWAWCQALAARKAASPERDCKATSTARWYN